MVSCPNCTTLGTSNSISKSYDLCLQIQEFDTPEHLLSNDEGAFSKMVQSTGPSNAEYLKVHLRLLPCLLSVIALIYILIQFYL
jgi:hypothetical protein